MNPYGLSVWNKTVNNKQFSIIFHIEDLKVSHKETPVVTLVFEKLEKEYTSHQMLNDKLTITRGKKHEYIGMNIIIDKGGVRILMHNYVYNLIK